MPRGREAALRVSTSTRRALETGRPLRPPSQRPCGDGVLGGHELSSASGSPALTSAALYAGATWYVAFVEQPSRLEAGSVDLAQWRGSNDRAPRYAASALVGAAAAFVLAARSTSGWPWVAGAVLLLAVLPWTVLTMLPIQRRLADGGATGASPETRGLIARWGRFHLGRLVLGLGGLGLFLVGALG